MKVLEEDGWRLDRQVGSHRQYRHPPSQGPSPSRVSWAKTRSRVR
ncbi:MAG: type II toxin-antitoxin system HicA family toxin [Candidatus Dormibacteria bacterium]